MTRRQTHRPKYCSTCTTRVVGDNVYSQQSRDVLDKSQKDERRHILGFAGDSPAHKDSLYGGTGCALPPPPPPRSCLAVTRTLSSGQVQTTLSDLSAGCCRSPPLDRRSPSTAVDEGYSSRPPSYVVCGPSAPVRRGDVTSGSAAAAGTLGQTIYAVRRAAVCCPGDYSCCHAALRRHHHHHLYQQPPQQQLLAGGEDGDGDGDDDRRQADDDNHRADDVLSVACQSSAADDALTSRNASDAPMVDTVFAQTEGKRTDPSTLHAAAQCQSA